MLVELLAQERCEKRKNLGTMAYSKPEVGVVCDAIRFIQTNTTKPGSYIEGPPQGQASCAYDLDD